MSDDPFDRSELEELFGLDALYPWPDGRARGLHRLVRSSAARELGLDDDEPPLLDGDDSDEDADEDDLEVGEGECDDDTD